MTTIANLTDEYTAWLAATGHPELSADELGVELSAARHEIEAIGDSLTADIGWLTRFVTRWEEAEAAERTDDTRFDAWRAAREWYHDLRDSVVGDENLIGPGYVYPGGYYIRLNTEPQQDLGRYWTMCPFDLWGDLTTCERALWAEYGSDLSPMKEAA